MDHINTYYQLSTEVKHNLNTKIKEMNPAQQLKAKQVLEAFEAAEKTFYQFRNEIAKLHDACAWVNMVNHKSDNSYADEWRAKFLKLKTYANGGELTSEVIKLLQ